MSDQVAEGCCVVIFTKFGLFSPDSENGTAFSNQWPGAPLSSAPSKIRVISIPIWIPVSGPFNTSLTGADLPATFKVEKVTDPTRTITYIITGITSSGLTFGPATQVEGTEGGPGGEMARVCDVSDIPEGDFPECSPARFSFSSFTAGELTLTPQEEIWLDAPLSSAPNKVKVFPPPGSIGLTGPWGETIDVSDINTTIFGLTAPVSGSPPSSTHNMVFQFKITNVTANGFIPEAVGTANFPTAPFGWVPNTNIIVVGSVAVVE